MNWFLNLFNIFKDEENETQIQEVKQVRKIEQVKKISRKFVVLSIAHYPKSPGAGYKGVYEHEVSKPWTFELKNQLGLLGIDCAVSPVGLLDDKVRFINSVDADACLEIHFNGAYNPNIRGVETLYCPGSIKGKMFARSVHMVYAPTMGVRDRGVKEGWYRMDRPGFEDYPGDKDGDERKDYFLEYTRCPALILEPDFISQLNNIDNSMKEACQMIALGISNYLRS